MTKLAEPVRRPSATWAGWEVAINRDGSTDRDIKQLSSTWIESNRAVFADWVAQAGAAK